MIVFANDSTTMTLPAEVFERIAPENDRRMWRMLGYMQAHTSMGYYFFMNKWQITTQNGVALYSQGVLLSTLEYDFMDIYPEGEYQCSMCGNHRSMDHQTHCFYSNDTAAVICPHCVNEAVHAQPVKARVEGISYQYVMPSENVEFIDMRMSPADLESQRKIHREHLKSLNTNMDSPYMFYNDKTLELLYKEHLAKRVVRRWRKYMERHRRSHVMKVLYHCVGMDMNASIMIARNIPVM